MDFQWYPAPLDKVDIVVREGKRTDKHGHFYFTTKPRVSPDVIQLLRYGQTQGRSADRLSQPTGYRGCPGRCFRPRRSVCNPPDSPVPRFLFLVMVT
jgi:hypothetical protein